MTSRITSHPRTGKQSDPTEKGKGKEKRLVEEETESESELEFEEALSKAKEDEEKRDQLRHKRGKHALQFNVVPGMKERVFNEMHNPNFNDERQFSLNRIEKDFLDILRQIKERGVEVDCSAKAINWAYFDDDDADATDYLAKLENPRNHYTWIASLIAAGTPSWASNGSQIYKSDLNIQDKQWARSKLKKRKREPVVAHVSETDLGIDSQVENDQAVEAQPSTSDTPSATQSTQSISADRMRSMDDIIVQMMGADPSSRAPSGEEFDTTETTTLAQSEEAKDA
ncbi:hypothetical protein HAX54_004929 [Datura stramonium]|uniref:Uncharacterized protein n=1 Tax=Datura stramonium TaxID=4076 RepID=A0ABS8T9F6_DATST|nr:hypothetical protein [Datura stramonium]